MIPAAIVREIYTRILAGSSISTIRRDLDNRSISTKTGSPWSNMGIRFIATNPTYIGQRMYHIGDVREPDRHHRGARA